MMPDVVRPRVCALVRAHALAWLLLANAVGLLLAALQVWPDLGLALGPLTYGRWVPVHLDGQLYGWCALPLVGALLSACLDERHPRAALHAGLALGAWTAALALGCVGWLAGGSSGKLFLEWSGWTRLPLPLAMCVLWTVLAAHLWWSRGGRCEWRWRVAAAWVVALCCVPPALHWAEGAAVYPSVNPDSGGATGSSLLASTLGFMVVVGGLPVLLGVRRSPGSSRSRIWALAAVSLLVLAAIDHGNESHHAPAQWLGLGVLLAWIPAGVWYVRAWNWSGPTLHWLGALACWWAALVLDGWILFLPGVSEHLKFTHALVAHSHLAMAGAVSSLGFAILNQLDPGRPFGTGWAFTLWQLGCLVQVVVLTLLGLGEEVWPAAAVQGSAVFILLLLLRLGAGGLMAAASWKAWRQLPL